MPRQKYIVLVDDEKEQQVLRFSRRFCYIFLTLGSFVFLTYLLNFLKYGYSKDGKLHHSFLDYPNQINSKEALELADFVESLQEQWKNDARIYYPFDKQLDNDGYWEKEIDVKDPVKKQLVMESIAKKLNISHSHHRLSLPPAEMVARKIRGGPPKKNIAIPNNMEYLTLQNNNQCDDQRLQFKTTKTISIDQAKSSQISVQLDGAFHDSGTVSVRKAAASEQQEHIKFNLTLYGQSDNVLSHVSLSEKDQSSTKVIQIRNRHPSTLTSCLTYHMEIVFPSKMITYKELDLKINHAQSIKGDLNGIQFQKLSVGLGRGAILFDNVKADHILLGNLNGIIRGTYSPFQSMGAATVKGSTLVTISPQTKHTKSTIVTLNGPVKALVTEPGVFTAHCWICQPSVSAKTNEIRYFPSRRPEIKSGFYETRHSSHTNVHSLQGESKLIYI